MNSANLIVTTTLNGREKKEVWDTSEPILVGYPNVYQLKKTGDGVVFYPQFKGGNEISVSSDALDMHRDIRLPGNGQGKLPFVSVKIREPRTLQPAYRIAKSTHPYPLKKLELHVFCSVRKWLFESSSINGAFIGKVRGRPVFTIEKTDTAYVLEVLSRGIALKQGDRLSQSLKPGQCIRLTDTVLSESALIRGTFSWRFGLLPSADPILYNEVFEKDQDSENKWFSRFVTTFGIFAVGLIFSLSLLPPIEMKSEKELTPDVIVSIKKTVNLAKPRVAPPILKKRKLELLEKRNPEKSVDANKSIAPQIPIVKEAPTAPEPPQAKPAPVKDAPPVVAQEKLPQIPKKQQEKLQAPLKQTPPEKMVAIAPKVEQKAISKKTDSKPAPSSGRKSIVKTRSQKIKPKAAPATPSPDDAVNSLFSGNVATLLETSPSQLNTPSPNENKAFDGAKFSKTKDLPTAGKIPTGKKLKVGTLADSATLDYTKVKPQPTSGHSNDLVKINTGDGFESDDGLTQYEIDQTIYKNLSQFRNCYESAMISNPNLSGKIKVSFSVSGNGSVILSGADSPKILSSTLKSTILENCLTSQISKLNFPTPKNNVEVKVIYPFEFKPLSGGY